MLKKVLYSVLGVIILVIVSVIVGFNTTSKTEQTQNNVPVHNPIVVATSSATTLSDAKQKVRTILSASIDHYVALLSAGKIAKGSIQYSSAVEGTAALSDPNSPASKISVFRNSICLQNDPTINLSTAYRDSSNIYYDAKLDSSVIDNWYSDMSEASSNICIWASDAISWEIKDVSTTKLSADESTITTDLAQARKDIERLR
jgi:hypothetical protein